MADIPKLSRPATADHLRKKKPYERRIAVVLDPAAAMAFERAEQELEAARPATGSSSATKRAEEVTKRLKEAQAVYDTALAALDGTVVTLLFRAVGRKRYDALLLAHPPIKDDDSSSYNEETFPPALIQASCVDPVLDDETIAGMYDEWNWAEISQLWVAALEVNTQAQVPDLGKV